MRITQLLSTRQTRIAPFSVLMVDENRPTPVLKIDEDRSTPVNEIDEDHETPCPQDRR
jgi:hypothetical protein